MTRFKILNNDLRWKKQRKKTKK